MKSAHKGFTLIELLIVIAIIGILAAVVMIAINPLEKMRQARDSGRKNDIGQLATALEAYYTSSTNARYPDGANAMQSLTASGDLKRILVGPTGEAYSIDANDGSPIGQTVSVWVTLEADSAKLGGTNTGMFCWQSAVGRAAVVTNLADCD